MTSGIYGVLAKWAQKKESYAAFSYALMVTMVTLSNSEFINEHGESLVVQLTAHAKREDRERDREGKDGASADERKKTLRKRDRSPSIDKSRKDPTVNANSLTMSSTVSTNTTSSISTSLSTPAALPPSSTLHYLSLLLTYFQTLNDVYVRQGSENYSRQMQTATQFLFSFNCLVMPSDQFKLMEKIAHVIVSISWVRPYRASNSQLGD